MERLEGGVDFFVDILILGLSIEWILRGDGDGIEIWVGMWAEDVGLCEWEEDDDKGWEWLGEIGEM